MTTVAPSSSQTPIGAAPVGTPASVQIELNGTSLSADVGNIITGTVLGRDPRGGVQLRTQNGIILLHTAAKLPPGATVTLQVQAVGAQIQAILLQVTPLSAQLALPLIETATAIPGHSPSQSTVAAGRAAAASQVALGTGPTVTATVIGPAREGPGPAAASPRPADAAPRPSTPKPATATAAVASVNAGGAPAAEGVAVQAALRPAAAEAQTSRSDPLSAPGLANASDGTAAPAPSLAAAPTTPRDPTPRTATGLPAAAASAPAAVATVSASLAPHEPAAALRAVDGALAPSVKAIAGTSPVPTPASVVTIADAPASVGAQATAHAYAVAQTAAPRRNAPAGTPTTAATAAASATAPPATGIRIESVTPEPAPATPSAPSGQPGATLPSRLTAGSELDVRVTRLGEAQIQAAAPGHPQIAGTIAGRTAAGQAIVDTPAGRLAVTLPSALGPAPEGVRVVLDVVAARMAPPLPHDAPARAAIEAATLRPVLDALADVARASRGRIDPHEILPRPGPQLAQRLAEVAAALSTGKVAEWLGEHAVRSLEQRGHGEAIRRLEGELYDAAKAAPQSPEWHGTVLPFHVGGQLQPLRLYIRRRNARARDRAAGTRFVLECAHDDLGELQLDGLVHERRIDVILRTHTALSDDMRGDIAALFGDACGVMGYAGTIEFHAEPAFPAMPRGERAVHSVGVVA